MAAISKAIALRAEEIRKEARGLTYEEILVSHRAYHLDRHVGKTDSELQARLKEEDVFASSGFYGDGAEVAEMISDAILDEEFQTPECIAEWLEDYAEEDEMVVIKTYDRAIGRSFRRSRKHDWSNGGIECDTIAVILQKVERKYDFGWKVKTAYPESSEF